MPSTNPLDPTNYTALIPSGNPAWHNGANSLTYSFLSEMPSYYTLNGSNVYDIGGETVSPGQNISLSPTQRAMAELAIERFNEVANLNLVPAGTAGTGGTPNGAAITGNGSLVGGLGGAAGFGELEAPRNDDGFQVYDISSVFENGLNFFGNTYSSLYVNTNGSVSFGNGISTYTPSTINGNTGTPIIAPFWADVDTRIPASIGTNSGPVYIDMDTVNDVLTFTWADVGYYDYNGDRKNSFQLQLFDRGGGNFDIVFRYDDINWTTGDASGGSGGLGGNIARAGYSSGNGVFYELAASGNQGAMLGLDSTVGNTGTTGLWAFSSTTAVGDVTFGVDNMTSDGPTTGGFAYYPGDTNSIYGDIWLNSLNSLVANPALYNFGWYAVIHELGHSVGLEHSFENASLPAILESAQYTVMSYDSHPTQAGIAGSAREWPATPMLYDIQALQATYGANMNTRTGNDVYFAAGGVSGFEIANGGQFIATIWDAGGIDTFSGEAQTSAVNIDLRPGYFSTIGSISNNIGIALGVAGTRATSAIIENAIGGSAGDTLQGNDVNNTLIGNGGNDTINGGAGNDILIGGTGADAMNGGSGLDYARYDEAAYGDIRISLQVPVLNTNVAAGDTFTEIEGLIMGLGNDWIYGDGGDNYMYAGGGNDNIFGSIGADYHNGGAGFDYARFDDAAYGNITVSLAAPSIGTSVAAGDVFVDIEGLILGGGDDWIYGDNDNNHLYGNSGSDSLFGSNGADYLHGGAGFDYARFDDAGYSGLVADLVGANTNTGAAAGDTFVEIEGLILTGNNDFGFGNEASNYIYGLGGNDYLDGRTGNDFLFGGTGNDTFHFMAGYGRDTVGDFNGGSGLGDRLDLQGVFGSFAAVIAASTQVGANLEIALNGTDVLVLNNFSISNFAADDVVI
ncbi:nidogen-like domain-containing protein [Hoeflea sp.]|uniref:nidogen-like domain-containing protein n=1 Tax=Hoeflea sp. TaxID=1940281 RepID=UPI003748D1EA